MIESHEPTPAASAGTKMATNPLGVKQGNYTYNGVFRMFSLTPNRTVLTDARDLIAHINEEGDVKLIGEFHNAFVEVCLTWPMVERIYKQALKQREQEPTND